jgi:hypothetical protein
VILPYNPEELFETPKEVRVTSFEDGVLIVDGWYKNYEEIKSIILNTPVPRWKWAEGGRNFVDYFDCRLVLPIHFTSDKTPDNLSIYWQLVSKFFGMPSAQLINNLYEFNYYKNVNKNVSRDLQHHPHVDDVINCIIYLDEISSGGTAVYKIDHTLENKEHDNLLFNVSKLDKKVIPAKPNRMVMFNGTQYHGGYIEDHNKYVDDWRINQVMFFKPV